MNVVGEHCCGHEEKEEDVCSQEKEEKSCCNEDKEEGTCCKEGTEEESCCQEEEKDLKDTLQRFQADFQNYKRRVEEDKHKFIKFANKELIKKLLAPIDNFTLALENKSNAEEFMKGVEMIYAQLFEVLREQGLETIEAKGKPFDPKTHEALLQVESDEPKGTVIEELQKGYILGDTVLRPSKVKVSKGKNDGGTEGEQQQ